MMEADDLAYNEDEDYQNPNISPELLKVIESKKYHRLCFDCLRKIKQEIVNHE